MTGPDWELIAAMDFRRGGADLLSPPSDYMRYLLDRFRSTVEPTVEVEVEVEPEVEPTVEVERVPLPDLWPVLGTLAGAVELALMEQIDQADSELETAEIAARLMRLQR